MDIAKNINSIKDTKQNLKMEIRKRGGDITDKTPFKDYPSFIKTIGVEYRPLGTVKASYTGTISEKTRSCDIVKASYTGTISDSAGVLAEWETEGDVKNSGGVYSGFSDSNYLWYTRPPYITSTMACEIVLDITTATDVGTKQHLIGSDFAFIHNMQWHINSPTSSYGGNVLSNTRYTVKLVLGSDGSMSLYRKFAGDTDSKYELMTSQTSRTKTTQLIICKGFKGTLHGKPQVTI